MMLTVFSPDFEVFPKKIKKKVFMIQRASFTRKWLITVFGLFEISLIIFIRTVLRPTKQDLFVCRKPCLS